MGVKPIFNATTGKLDFVQKLDEYSKNPISVTHAELYAMINAGTLTPKQWYLITDFSHKTIVAGTESDTTPAINNGAVEQIYVQANSASTLSPRAYSKTYDGEEILFKTFGTTLYKTDEFYYSLGDETYLSVTGTDELTFVDDMFPSGFTGAYIYIENYDTGTSVTFTKDDYGTKWTWDSATKKLTNLYGVLTSYYIEYYDGEPSSLNITPTGQYTFTCDTDELDTWFEGYIYLYDNDSDAGGELYASDRGVTWDYDASTHTFTLLSGAEFYDGFSFLDDWYGEFSLVIVSESDWSDEADIYVEGSCTTISEEFNGKIVGRKIPSQDFEMAGDFRSQLTRRYKVLCDDWSAGTYSAGSVVRYDGSIWTAIVSTTDTPSTSTANNWFRCCYDDYILASTMYIAYSTAFLLTKDTSNYYDYPIIPLASLTSFVNTKITNFGTTDEINIYVSGTIQNSNLIVGGASFKNVASATGVYSNSYAGFLSNVTISQMNTCINNNSITSSMVLNYTTCINNSTISSSNINYMVGCLMKGSFSTNSVYDCRTTAFYGSAVNTTIVYMSNCQFINNIDNNYFQNFYSNTCSNFVRRSMFFSDTYFNNFLGQVLDCSIFGRAYGSSNTVRATYGYTSNIVVLGSMTLNYFSSGVNITNTLFAKAFSNNFTSANPASTASRITDNVFLGNVVQWSGVNSFNFYESFCAGAVSFLVFNNVGRQAILRGNTILGQFGSAGTGITFNNTTENAQIRFNLFKAPTYGWTITRGIIEWNEFLGSLNNTWGSTATFTFSYNAVGLGFNNNTINGDMSYNTLPSGWASKSITSANAFNYLFLTNAIGGLYRPISASGNAAETDYHVAIDASGASRTLTLLASVGSGRTIVVSKSDSSANAVVVAAAGTDNINGVASVSLLQQFETIWLQDVTVGGWRILNQDKNIVTGTLTSTRVPFADANGRLTDDADLTFVTDTLYATKVQGAHNSSDGTSGITQDVDIKDFDEVTHSLSFKDGLLVSYSNDA